jgi:hypothetical protein
VRPLFQLLPSEHLRQHARKFLAWYARRSAGAGVEQPLALLPCRVAAPCANGEMREHHTGESPARRESATSDIPRLCWRMVVARSGSRIESSADSVSTAPDSPSKRRRGRRGWEEQFRWLRSSRLGFFPTTLSAGCAEGPGLNLCRPTASPEPRQHADRPS